MNAKKIALWTILAVLVLGMLLILPSRSRLEAAKLSARFNNPIFCSLIALPESQGDYDISVEELRYFCVGDYAALKEDVALCLSLDAAPKFIGTVSLRNYCIRNLARRLNDSSICENLALFGWEAEYLPAMKDACRTETAMPWP